MEETSSEYTVWSNMVEVQPLGSCSSHGLYAAVNNALFCGPRNVSIAYVSPKVKNGMPEIICWKN